MGGRTQNANQNCGQRKSKYDIEKEKTGVRRNENRRQNSFSVSVLNIHLELHVTKKK